jgi:coatomer subunit beta'
VVELWRNLTKVGEKAGQSLADPVQYPNLFPHFNDTLHTEEYLKREEKKRLPAEAYPSLTPNQERAPMKEMKAALEEGRFTPSGLVLEKSLPSNLPPPLVKSTPLKDYQDQDDMELEIENMNLDDIDPNVSLSYTLNNNI